ncbi:hypothetical protein GSI_07363 [Ganoderma sinense ZZ0214-1]|uniref:F-box domain-containing protein n=1 Tax=Ganoderma sinense ZZ0214-1 TaxID=1077348 RepID=A0A2G8SA91_9APHY|nr:hypothetical protein GSI_07363 [Ganoderma sinense ZZ0214-1]
MDPLHNIPRLSELSEHLLRLSTTDRASLSALTSVSDIQKWTAAKADEYRQFSLALLAIHNLAAPIHRLPTEVLERVFSYCWHDRASLRLLHVCSLWRSIILGRAAFWAEAATKCGPLFDKRPVMHDDLPFVNAVLSRSACYSHGIAPFFHGFSPNIVKSLTPYIGNVVSLRVTLDRPSDLHEGLWPVLRSGVPKLNALHIELVRITDLNEDIPEWDLDEDSSNPLAILSHENLPQLSRLVCQPAMVRLFGGVPLKSMTVATGRDDPPELSEDDTSLRHLEPYRLCLERLEAIGEIFWDGERPAEMQAFQFTSLRDLRIKSRDSLICPILSWLAFPQSAYVHITNSEAFRGPPFQRLLSRTNCVALRRVVTAVDHVCIRCLSRRFGNHTLIGFASNAERFRLENFVISPEGLVEVFSTNPSITRLSLFLAERMPLEGEVDLRAFPHLVHLDMTAPDMDILVRILGSTDKLRRRPAEPKPPLCLSLANLVITCGLTVVRAAAAPPPPKSKPKGPTKTSRSTSKSDRNPGPGPTQPRAIDVDEVFERKCSILQQVLAHLASSGTRLSSLTLRLHPVTREILGRNSASGDTGSAESHPRWPSPAARQSVLEGLQRLVDGPVVLEFLDRAAVDVDWEAAV